MHVCNLYLIQYKWVIFDQVQFSVPPISTQRRKSNEGISRMSFPSWRPILEYAACTMVSVLYNGLLMLRYFQVAIQTETFCEWILFINTTQSWWKWKCEQECNKKSNIQSFWNKGRVNPIKKPSESN